MKFKQIGKFLMAALTAEKDLIVGGQAVIEGVMMRTPGAYGIAVRKPDGTIATTAAVLPKWGEKYPMLKWPVLRGGAMLIQSMALGVKALNYSASAAMVEEPAAEAETVVSMQPVGLTADFGSLPITVTTTAKPGGEKKANAAGAAGSIVFAMFFNVLLFIVAPLLLTNALFIAVGWAPGAAVVAPATPGSPAVSAPATNVAAAPETAPWYQRVWGSTRAYLHPVRPSVLFNLIDGGIRMLFFITMIFSFSLIKDIRRVFEYHGAEHKTVFTWEYGLPLTVENARGQRRQHPRCGTSFLMVVMLVSIVLFSVIKFDSLLLNMAVRIALMPLVAGLSYEIIRLSAKKESSIIFKIITRPGVWLQNITTKEPDDSQLEIAIEALKESLKLEPEPAPAH